MRTEPIVSDPRPVSRRPQKTARVGHAASSARATLARARTMAWLLAHLPRHVENWESVAAALVLGYTPFGPSVLELRTRDGGEIHVPNYPSARAPVFEVIVYDEYRIDAMVDDLRSASSPWIVDIGAHVGSFTVALASRLDRARFTCVEPCASTAGMLRDNIAANALAERVRICEVAVGGCRGAGWLRSNGPADSCASLEVEAPGRAAQRLSGGGTPSSANGQASQARQPDQVDVLALEDLLSPADARVDLLKMDCEGAEYGVVASASDALWARVDRVVLEYHPGGSFIDLERRLVAAGLGLERLNRSPVTPGLGLAWFSRPGGRLSVA